MAKYLELQKFSCKNCYKCIRNCSVKSINFTKNRVNIIQDECILCGQCYVVCPQGAKEVWSQLDTVRGLIASGRPVVASVAPSFVADFPANSIQSMEKALQKLGFTMALETAQGATLVKNEFEQMMERQSQEVIISSCCPSVNLLIQKYYPDCLKHLAHVASPMVAHCRSIKNDMPDAATVFIGPCIAKLDEGQSNSRDVDAVLTFEQLASWLEQEGVEFEPTPNPEKSGRAAFFPTGGGIIKSFAKSHPDYEYIVVDGIQRCIQTLQDLREGGIGRCFIEMSACVGSCVGGPVMNKGRAKVLRSYSSVHGYAGEQELKCLGLPKGVIDVKFTYIGTGGVKKPEESEVVAILRSMGKQSRLDELNCGSCGYETCREKAVAVYNNKADVSMCLPYLKEKAENFSDIIINNTPNGIMVLSDDLIVQQINRSALAILNLEREEDVIGEPVVRILDPTDFDTVLKSRQNLPEKRTYLAEYKKYVDYSVIFDQSYNVMILIMKDVTEQELLKGRREDVKEKAIETTNKVIDNQMKIVQEIAFLLGETAAETKIALTRLKDSLNDE